MHAADRPNQPLAICVFQAQKIAREQSRQKAANFLLDLHCPLPVIARVLYDPTKTHRKPEKRMAVPDIHEMVSGLRQVLAGRLSRAEDATRHA